MAAMNQDNDTENVSLGMRNPFWRCSFIIPGTLSKAHLLNQKSWFNCFSNPYSSPMDRREGENKMKQECKGNRCANKKGALVVVVKVSVALFIFGIFLGAFGWNMGWCSESAEVGVKEDLSSHAALNRYGWFKELSAHLNKKQSEIDALKLRLSALGGFYKNTPFYLYSENHKKQAKLWLSEVARLKAGFNDLATRYNSEHAKLNWRFANMDELPKGAEKTLPKEYELLYTGKLSKVSE